MVILSVNVALNVCFMIKDVRFAWRVLSGSGGSTLLTKAPHPMSPRLSLNNNGYYNHDIVLLTNMLSVRQIVWL